MTVLTKVTLLIFALAINSIAFSGQENGIVPQFAKTNKKVSKILAEWQRERNILIDGRSVRLISGDIEYFRGIYGKPEYNPKFQQALDLLANSSLMKATIYEYMDDATADENLVTLLSRLVKGIGMKPGLDGNPAIKTNQFKLKNYDQDLPEGTYELATQGITNATRLDSRRILIQGGSHKITNVTTGESWNLDEEGIADVYRDPEFVRREIDDRQHWGR